jgi:hypothetical protein
MPSNRTPKKAPRRKPRLDLTATSLKRRVLSAAARATVANLNTLDPSRESPSQELQRYRAGEISEAEYLDACIERATQHLRGRVSPHRLGRIRELVGELCATDPVLDAMKARLLRPPK